MSFESTTTLNELRQAMAAWQASAVEHASAAVMGSVRSHSADADWELDPTWTISQNEELQQVLQETGISHEQQVAVEE